MQVLVHNVQEVVRYKQRKESNLPKRITALWPIEYASKLDDSPELKPYLASHYRSLICISYWIVELCHVYMIVEVSALASHMALSCEGQLLAVCDMLS